MSEPPLMSPTAGASRAKVTSEPSALIVGSKSLTFESSSSGAAFGRLSQIGPSAPPGPALRSL
jgi:hypothetical protein